jgi:uncharacterized membrane protein (DUF485 family)
MTQPHGTVRGGADPPTDHWGAGSDYHPDIDWEAAEQSPEFRELVTRKKSFVVPATIFFLGWYFGFIILAGYAEDFMGEEFLVDGLTVGYVLALTQFIMTWGLAAWYLRKSDHVFDPLAKRAAERALQAGRGDGSGRFERSPTGSGEEVTRR